MLCIMLDIIAIRQEANFNGRRDAKETYIYTGLLSNDT
jgi:hypothetical protein